MFLIEKLGQRENILRKVLLSYISEFYVQRCYSISIVHKCSLLVPEGTE